MFRFVPSLPDEFPLGRDGIQGSMIGKNIIVCSPGASKLVRVQPVLRRPVLRPIDQFTPFQARKIDSTGVGKRVVPRLRELAPRGQR